MQVNRKLCGKLVVEPEHPAREVERADERHGDEGGDAQVQFPVAPWPPQEQQAERAEVDRIVFDELTLGRVEERSRATYVELIEEFRRRGADAVVLGCTEIELLLGPDDVDVPVFATTRLHALAAVDFALS